MPLECDAKFEEKLTCGLENDRRNLANFHQGTRNSQNWKFHWILLYKIEKCAILKLKGELYVVTMKSDAKFEMELTCHFRIDMRNLINFDPSTKTSQKFKLLSVDFEQSI